MSNALAEKSCTPCRGGIPLLTAEEAVRYLAQAPEWDLARISHRGEAWRGAECSWVR